MCAFFLQAGIAAVIALPAIALDMASSGITSVQSNEAEVDIWKGSGSFFTRPSEANMASLLSSLPRVFVSTIKDHGQLVALYARENKIKSAPTEEVRQLAVQITAGKANSAEKSEAVFDWVLKNIRYVAVYLGAGGFVGHDTTWSLNIRCG